MQTPDFTKVKALSSKTNPRTGLPAYVPLGQKLEEAIKHIEGFVQIESLKYLAELLNEAQQEISFQEHQAKEVA